MIRWVIESKDESQAWTWVSGNAIHSDGENRGIRFEGKGSNEFSFTNVECEGPVRYQNGDNGKMLNILFGVQECSLGCRYNFESHQYQELQIQISTGSRKVIEMNNSCWG